MISGPQTLTRPPNRRIGRVIMAAQGGEAAVAGAVHGFGSLTLLQGQNLLFMYSLIIQMLGL